MPTEVTNIVTFTNPDGFLTSKTNWYTLVSDGGTSMIPITLDASVAQITQTALSTIFLTLTTIVPSSALTWKSPSSSVSSIDTTAVALSSIASYNSVQATATDPWTKDHLSSAISQYASGARLSIGYTTTSSASRSTAISPSYESIGATATDPVLKGELRSSISQLSELATLTDGVFSNCITISPSEQSAIDRSNEEIAKKQQLYTGLIAFAAAAMLMLVAGMVAAYFVRMRRRRKAKNFPPLTQHVSPGLSSFGGLMAEMGRENTVGEQNRIIEGVQRIPTALNTQSSLREAEIPEGIAELPGSTPEIEPRSKFAAGSLERMGDLEKVGCELGGRKLPLPIKSVTIHETMAPGNNP